MTSAKAVLERLIWISEPAPGGFVRILVTPAMIEQMREASDSLD